MTGHLPPPANDNRPPRRVRRAGAATLRRFFGLAGALRAGLVLAGV
jgi:hypothetical protein